MFTENLGCFAGRAMSWARWSLLCGALVVASCGDDDDDDGGETGDDAAGETAGETSDAVQDPIGGDDADDGDDDDDVTDGAAYADEFFGNPIAGPGVSVVLNAVNGVRGGGERQGSLDVFSLGLDAGVNDSLTLGWKGRRVLNVAGDDLVVFENAFRFGDDAVFMDLLVVSVSIDGESWVTFRHAYVPSREPDYANGYVASPAAWQGFAGKTPVLFNEETNRVDLFDGEAAGGDGFDLDDLDDSPLATEIKANGFVFVRLTAAGTQIDPATGAPFLVDPVSNGPDIDGVYARAFAPRE